jgi:hypothetical protein
LYSIKEYNNINIVVFGDLCFLMIGILDYTAVKNSKLAEV